MRKKPNSTHRTYNLDDSTIKLIDFGANSNGISRSDFIQFLANSWEAGLNFDTKIKTEKEIQKQHLKQVYESKKKEKELISTKNRADNWKNLRQKDRARIVSNLVRIIKQGRYQDAEVVAKNQSISLGVTAVSLLIEAVEKSGQKR